MSVKLLIGSLLNDFAAEMVRCCWEEIRYEYKQIEGQWILSLSLGRWKPFRLKKIKFGLSTG
jgi:hypothetical protein